MTQSIVQTRDGGGALDRWRCVERSFAFAFGAANPWHHLGALAFFLFWIITLTGIYVYALFDTSVTGASQSVEAMTVGQWYLGGVMRSVHRYASDAFVLVMTMHLLKETLAGHFRGFRWFSWLTGVPLIWLSYASGIGGYWLVWDQLAQFSIVATAEWLDWLPLGRHAIIRNFIGSVDDRFFSLLIFLHIGIPLLLLAVMWLHIQRISRARTSPPRALAIGTLIALLAAAVVAPATSHVPADLAVIPLQLRIDWFLLFIHPLQYATSPGTLWALAGGATLALALLPAFSRAPRPAAAVVNPGNCNGCGRCFEDCPYAAVVIDPRPGGRGGLARVLPDLCAGCGICAGACPSSTPFRSAERIVTGIDLPQAPIDQVRATLDRVIPRLRGSAPVIVFGCRQSAGVGGVDAPDTATIELECAGMLAPSFIEYAIRAGARGAMIVGCREGECEFRIGMTLTRERIDGIREPHLRANVPRAAVKVVERAIGEEAMLPADLAAFRSGLPEDVAARRSISARVSGHD